MALIYTGKELQAFTRANKMMSFGLTFDFCDKFLLSYLEM